MGTRVRLIILSLLMFAQCKPEQKEYVINPAKFIYGQWRCKKHMWWTYSRYTGEQLDEVLASPLFVEKDRVYFEGSNIIKPYFFPPGEVIVEKLSEEDVEDCYTIQKGPLKHLYTKEELRKLNSISLGKDAYGLGAIYLDKDIMILNYCGGVTFFMEKIPAIEKHYQGKNSSRQTLDLANPCEFVKLTYSVKGTPAQLIIKDQQSKTLFRILLEGNEQTKTVYVPLAKVTQLTFEISSLQPNLEWNIDTLVYGT